MNATSARPPQSPLFYCSRLAAVAFLVFITLAPTISPTTAAPAHASTLMTLAKIRETWVLDLRTKQL